MNSGIGIEGLPADELRARRSTYRLVVAATIGSLCAIISYMSAAASPGERAGDLAQHWIAARALLAGDNPYFAVVAAGWPWPYLYPGTTPLVSSVFAWMPFSTAQAAFAGFSAGVLAFAVTRLRWWGLLIFLTPSFLHGFYHAQWTPLLVGLMLMPVAGGFLVVKPTTGLACFLARPSWPAAAVGGVLVIASLLVMPLWPHEWRLAVTGATHIVPPIVRPGGFLLLLALPLWKRADARLVVGLACVPHLTMLYETLPLFTVARTFRQMASLVVLAAIGAWLILHNVPADIPDVARYSRQWPYLLGFFYLPALGLVYLNRSMSAQFNPAIVSLPDEQ